MLVLKSYTVTLMCLVTGQARPAHHRDAPLPLYAYKLQGLGHQCNAYTSVISDGSVVFSFRGLFDITSKAHDRGY